MDELAKMDDFTNEEKHRIDVIYGNDFKDLTIDDVKLIQKYEAYKARNDEIVQAKIKAIEAESAAQIKETKKTEKLARDILTAKAEAARERWEVLRNGQEK